MWTGAGAPCVPLPDPDPGWETGLEGDRGTRARGADTPEHRCPGPPGPRPPPLQQVRGSGGNPLEVLLWCRQGHVARPGWTEPGEPDVDQQVPRGPQGPGAIQGHVHLPPALLETAAAEHPPGPAGLPPVQVPADSRATGGEARSETGECRLCPAGLEVLVRQQTPAQLGREAGGPRPGPGPPGCLSPRAQPCALVSVLRCSWDFRVIRLLGQSVPILCVPSAVL